MFTRNISVIDAYSTLHLELRRSFFVYPFDLQFLKAIEHRITEVLGKPKRASIRPTSPIAKWNPFSFPRSPTSNEGKEESKMSVIGKRKKSDGSSAPIESWMTHSRFDGSLPSRIDDHLYLGNLQVSVDRIKELVTVLLILARCFHRGHALNSGMLKALGITHVVSVGETLANETCFIHGHYVDSSELSGHCKPQRKLDKEDQAIRMWVVWLGNHFVHLADPRNFVEWIYRTSRTTGKIICRSGIIYQGCTDLILTSFRLVNSQNSLPPALSLRKRGQVEAKRWYIV